MSANLSLSSLMESLVSALLHALYMYMHTYTHLLLETCGNGSNGYLTSVNNSVSSPLPVVSGDPQGSMLGPPLFCT